MYDGSCPLCTKEIALYQKLEASEPIAWVDVSDPQQALPPGTSQQQLMQRFHVRTAHGELLDGAAAFVHLWAQLPGWRHLATLSRCPGALPLMNAAYHVFLRWRPALQRWAKRRAIKSGKG
jgi:predicted DCC family thiol-disulfide oxidoreductase YuxK